MILVSSSLIFPLVLSLSITIISIVNEAASKSILPNPTAKFDETIEFAFRMGVDPSKSDQAIRSTVALPHGTGKDVRVIVFALGDAAEKAKDGA